MLALLMCYLQGPKNQMGSFQSPLLLSLFKIDQRFAIISLEGPVQTLVQKVNYSNILGMDHKYSTHDNVIKFGDFNVSENEVI